MGPHNFPPAKSPLKKKKRKRNDTAVVVPCTGSLIYYHHPSGKNGRNILCALKNLETFEKKKELNKIGGQRCDPEWSKFPEMLENS